MKKFSIGFLILAFGMTIAVTSVSAQGRRWQGDNGRSRTVYRGSTVRVVSSDRYYNNNRSRYYDSGYYPSRSYRSRGSSRYDSYSYYYPSRVRRSYSSYGYPSSSYGYPRYYRSYPRRSGFSLGISIGSGSWW